MCYELGESLQGCSASRPYTSCPTERGSPTETPAVTVPILGLFPAPLGVEGWGQES